MNRIIKKKDLTATLTLPNAQLSDLGPVITIYRSAIRTKKNIPIIVMVACKNCGHEYKSEVLQRPDEETLHLSPTTILYKIVPSATKSQVPMDQTFIGNKPHFVMYR